MPNKPAILRCSSCRTLNRVPTDKLSANPRCGQCKFPLEFPRFPVDVSGLNFDREADDWPEYLLLEFWAKWCGYCRMIEPVLSDMASWKAGRLKIIRIDIDREESLAKRFAIKATPTLIILRNGKQLGRMDGAPKEKLDLVRWIDQFMRS
jgi:thioredoxin 2